MKNKRNPFIAVSEIASKNRWCWKLTCTTCGATELRSSLQKIAEGFHKHFRKQDFFLNYSNFLKIPVQYPPHISLK